MKCYEDMYGLPHPVSKKHPQMPIRDRAAQFAPFAALSGFEDATEETGRLTEQRRWLDESQKEEVDRQIRLLLDRPGQKAEITYYEPDAKKEGGAYKSENSALVRINELEGTILLESGTVVKIEDIFSIVE